MREVVPRDCITGNYGSGVGEVHLVVFEGRLPVEVDVTLRVVPHPGAVARVIRGEGCVVRVNPAKFSGAGWLNAGLKDAVDELAPRPVDERAQEHVQLAFDQPVEPVVQDKGDAVALHRPGRHDPEGLVVLVNGHGDLEAVLLGVSDRSQEVALGALAPVEHAIGANVGPPHPAAAVHVLAPTFCGVEAARVPEVPTQEAACSVLGMPT